MPDQPSKESLERAGKWLRHACGDGKCPHQKSAAHKTAICITETCLALEFDALLKDHEQDCDYIRGFNAGRRELSKQNAALVSALRDTRLILAGYCAQNPRWFYAGQEQDPSGAHALLEKVDEILALCAPAEAEAKEKP